MTSQSPPPPERSAASSHSKLSSREMPLVPGQSGLPPTAGAGWHPDPLRDGRDRWFDGNEWTDTVRDRLAPATVQPSQAADSVRQRISQPLLSQDPPVHTTSDANVMSHMSEWWSSRPTRERLTIAIAALLLIVVIVIAFASSASRTSSGYDTGGSPPGTVSNSPEAALKGAVPSLAGISDSAAHNDLLAVCDAFYAATPFGELVLNIQSQLRLSSLDIKQFIDLAVGAYCPEYRNSVPPSWR